MDDLATKLSKYRAIQVFILRVIVVMYVIVFSFSVYKSIGKDTKDVIRVHKSLSQGQTIFAFICGLASAILVCVGLATYIYLPKMRNSIHGQMRMCFMGSQLVISLSNPIMAIVDNFHIVPTDDPLLNAVALQLPRISSLVYCCWLTVMGYLTWSTFSQPLRASGVTMEPNLLLYCCLFSWGYPSALFVLQQVCDFGFDFSILNALTISWMFTIPVNLVLITSTIINLRLHKSTTEGSTVISTEDIVMYLKLASLTGIDWAILCFAMITKIKLVMMIGYCILLLQGCFQFMLFTFNKRVFELLKEKRGGKGIILNIFSK